MLHRVTFTINIPPNVSIYTIHGSYGYPGSSRIHVFMHAKDIETGSSLAGCQMIPQ